MKVGGGLGSEGTLSSVLSPMNAFSRVLGYPSLEKKIQNFDPQGCHDRASDRIMAQTLNTINM